MKKRMMAMLLAAVMAFSVLGGGAFAAAEPEETAAPGNEIAEIAAEASPVYSVGETDAPVLKVEGEDVLLSAYPWDEGDEIMAPLTDGSPISDGMGYIMMPAEYAAKFPAAGVEVEGIYLYDWDSAPDTPIYHVYAFEVTDPALTEVTVTVVPNPDPPMWTKVTIHTHGNFYWEMHDCSADWYHGEHVNSGWTFYALEDAGGFALDLTEAPGVKPLMTTGTAEDMGGGMYTLHGQDGVMELDMGGIRINYTGETDALLNSPAYVSISGDEYYVDLYTQIGYTVVPADENAAVTVGYFNEVDGEYSLHYHISADAAAKNGADSVTFRVDKITSVTLSVDDPAALLAADPYDSDRGPILTDGDVTPPEGGWILARSDVSFGYHNSSYDLVWTDASYGEPGSEIYVWWYIYPLKNGELNVTTERSDTQAHWAEVTVDNPGGWDLYLEGYSPRQEVAFEPETYPVQMIVYDYLFVQSHSGSLREADYIIPGEGVLSVEEGEYYILLNLDPAAEKISFTVKAPKAAPAPESGTGWSYDYATGDWYFYKKGKLVSNYWVGKVDGASQWDNNWYYVGADGRMLTGMQYLDDLHGGKGWYFLQQTNDRGEIGKMLTGWQWVGGEYGECYFSKKNGEAGKCTWSEKLGDFDPAAGQWTGG